jgi:hypothetical protein
MDVPKEAITIAVLNASGKLVMESIKFEGTNLENTYKQIMKDLYMPQKDKVSPAPAGPCK